MRYDRIAGPDWANLACGLETASAVSAEPASAEVVEQARMLRAEFPVQRNRTLSTFCTSGPSLRLTSFDDRRGHVILDAASGCPGCYQLAPFRLRVDLDVDEPGVSEP